MEEINFSHVDLNDVSPDFENLPEGFYTLRWVKGVVKEKIRDDGSQVSWVSGRFVVTGPDEVAGTAVVGRTLFDSFFANKWGLRTLRWIADKTGIIGGPIDQWLEEMNTAQPEFRVTITEQEDRDRDGNPRSLDFKGECAKVNRIVWRDIQPAM